MRSVNKSYKLRIYPTKEQSVLLNKHIGSCRFIWNHFLSFKKTEYETAKKSYSRFDIQKELTKFKKNEEYSWLKEVNSQSLQCVIQNLDIAYSRFFKHTSDFPKFKSKKNGGSFKATQGIQIKGNKIFIPKFKDGINAANLKIVEGKIINASIVKTPTGKYYISFQCLANIEQLPIRTETIGMDLGLKSFAVTSVGEVIDNPKFLHNQLKKIKYLSRRHSKKHSKSSNKEKARIKLARQYEKVTNQRSNFLHQTSYRLINENQVICLEDLNVKGMMKRCKPKQDENGKYLHNGQTAKSGLNKSIADVSWYEFVRQLCYKADWYGRQIVFINRFYPSSKTCSKCGWINQGLDLSIRNWICPECNSNHDRDFNAATNIHKIGMSWFDSINNSKNFSKKNKNKTGLGTKSVYKQKPQEALSTDKSMSVESLHKEV